MIPHDLDAEAECLGSAVDDKYVRERLVNIVTADDFYKPLHRTVFEGLLGASLDGEPADMTLLAARCGVDRKTLFALRSFGSITSWVAKAKRVADLGARRRAAGELDKARAAILDPSKDLVECLTAVGQVPDRVAPRLEPVEVSDIIDLKEEEERSGWAVPGVMRRRERLILTGQEGAGKSALGRWVAMAVAAGRAPFSIETPIPSLPTLVIDMENESYDVGDAARRVKDVLGYQGGCKALSRTQGIDLTRPRDVRWLSSVVEAERPALVVIGPLYKMYRGAEGRGKHSEEAAEIVSANLDEIRVAYDCALWIEAHAAKGEGGNRDGGVVRGSGLWWGWPNFARWLERNKSDESLIKLHAWRFDRHRGRAFPWGLRETRDVPWVPVWNDPTLRAA